MNGKIKEFMKEAGSKIKCMEEEYLNGVMEECMKVNILKIKNKE
jgi:hypothetical protein